MSAPAADTPAWRAFLRRQLAAQPALIFCIVLMAVGAAQSPVFLSPINVGNLIVQIAPLLLVAIGQTYAVGSGGLDLSVGSTVSLVAVIAAVLFVPLGIPAAVALAVLTGLAVGALNGIFVSRGIEPFLVTLATLGIAQGVALFINPVPGGTVPAAFRALAGYQGAMPTVLPLLVILSLVALWSIRRSRIGAHLVAVGDNKEVAYLCGVPVRRTLLTAYVLSALFAALAALFLVARTSTGDPTIGARFTIDSLAAVVLGGTLLGGGRVSMLGTILGAVALGLLSNVLNLLQVPAFYQTPVKGVLVIGAVLLPSLIARGVASWRARQLAASIAAAEVAA